MSREAKANTYAALASQEEDESVSSCLRKEYMAVLGSRRTASAPLSGRHVKENVVHPFLQREASAAFHEMHSEKGPAALSELHQEHLVLTTEEGAQGQVPLLIIKSKPEPEEDPNVRRPVVIFQHSTGRSKEMMIPEMQAYAMRGYLTAAIDCRYHGERASSDTSYQDALIRAWKTGTEMPFIYDTVWDLIKLVDYLVQQPDVDVTRIGMTGVSLGGMLTWFTAFADTRIAVAVPWIGVQSFGWAVEHDRWQARVASIPHVFQAAAKDLGKPSIDATTVATVWQKIAPGLTHRFDAPNSLPTIAPRPLLVLNGAKDFRCPVDGFGEILSNTKAAYVERGVQQNFEFKAYEKVGHETCPDMGVATAKWFDSHLQMLSPFLLA